MEMYMSTPRPTIDEAIADLSARMSQPTVAASDTAPELAPKIEKFGLAENCRQLIDEGYTVVQDVASPEFFARLRKVILEKFSPYASLLAHQDPVFAEAALNPKLRALADFSVGPGSLLSFLGSTVRPQNDQSIDISLHCDQTWVPAPFPQHNLHLTCCWATDEFSREGGATMVVPRSHEHRRNPSEEEVAAMEGAIAIECPPGSVAVWDGSVWHGNWPRTLPGERVVLHVLYSRLMMRTMESYPLEIEEQLVAEYGDGMAELLGRHDFLNKPAGKSDVVGFYEAVRNSRL
jgi:hypothetical protein